MRDDLLQLNSLTVAASPVRDLLDVNEANDEQLESTAFVPTEEDRRSDSASSLDHTDYHSDTDPRASDGDTNDEPATSSPLDTDDSPQSRSSDTPETIKITITQDQFDGAVSERNEDEAPKFILTTDEVRSVENEKRAFVPTSILKQKKDLLPLLRKRKKQILYK
jgi:hypothetical protein